MIERGTLLQKRALSYSLEVLLRGACPLQFLTVMNVAGGHDIIERGTLLQKRAFIIRSKDTFKGRTAPFCLTFVYVVPGHDMIERGTLLQKRAFSYIRSNDTFKG